MKLYGISHACANWGKRGGGIAICQSGEMVELALGLRVVRGPNWDLQWGDQDGGEGFVGTVVGLEEGGDAVIVQWDMGQRCRYRCGYDNMFDLRVLDSGPSGKSHWLQATKFLPTISFCVQGAVYLQLCAMCVVRGGCMGWYGGVCTAVSTTCAHPATWLTIIAYFIDVHIC